LSLHDIIYCCVVESNPKPKGKVNKSFFSTQFGELLVTVMSLLEKNCLDKLEICKKFCIMLRISDDSDQLLFDDKEIQELMAIKSFDELLMSFSCNQIQFSAKEKLINNTKSPIYTCVHYTALSVCLAELCCFPTPGTTLGSIIRKFMSHGYQLFR